MSVETEDDKKGRAQGRHDENTPADIGIVAALWLRLPSAGSVNTRRGQADILHAQVLEQDARKET